MIHLAHGQFLMEFAECPWGKQMQGGGKRIEEQRTVHSGQHPGGNPRGACLSQTGEVEAARKAAAQLFKWPHGRQQGQGDV